jgi:hypothetical protein
VLAQIVLLAFLRVQHRPLGLRRLLDGLRMHRRGTNVSSIAHYHFIGGGGSTAWTFDSPTLPKNKSFFNTEASEA